MGRNVQILYICPYPYVFVIKNVQIQTHALSIFIKRQPCVTVIFIIAISHFWLIDFILSQQPIPINTLAGILDSFEIGNPSQWTFCHLDFRLLLCGNALAGREQFESSPSWCIQGCCKIWGFWVVSIFSHILVSWSLHFAVVFGLLKFPGNHCVIMCQ